MRKSFILFACLLAVACKKDELPPEPAISLTEALTGYTWNLQSFVLQLQDGSSSNLTNITFRACDLDDLLSFRKDGVYVKTDGPLVCDPQSITVFDRLNGAGYFLQDSVLTISAGLVFASFKVTAWSRARMTWKQSQTNYFGEKETYIYDFKAK